MNYSISILAQTFWVSNSSIEPLWSIERDNSCETIASETHRLYSNTHRWPGSTGEPYGLSVPDRNIHDVGI
jgi:hypothetical protein